MAKYEPTLFVDIETGEILRKDYKETYNYKTQETIIEARYENGQKIIKTTKLIKIYGRKEKQLSLF